IRIAPKDLQFLKFLWKDTTGHLRVFQMTSVPFDTTISPFLLATTLQHHFKQMQTQYPIVGQLKGQIYVDNITITTNRASEIHQLREQTERLFAECSMTVHKFRTSAINIDQVWRGEAQTTLKVLGCGWNVETDHLFITLPIIDAPQVTLRVLLKQLGSLYDP